MMEELKSTQICYAENVKMMQIENCIVFGNKYTLQRILDKITERTVKVIRHDAIVTMDGEKYHHMEYLCGKCKKKVLGEDTYCSHCGALLDWREDVTL